jgi:hypothetical protein
MKRRRGCIASAAAQAAALAAMLGGLIAAAMTVRCRVGNRLRQRPVVNRSALLSRATTGRSGDRNR